LEASKILNIGIVAHVDAGKTSITEQLLYQAGSIGNSGNVDKGTSTTDWLDIEKKRGISIRTATASLVWNNVKINIIDTPGHVDFSSEVSRSFMAMDFVIIVVSAVEGIQGHTSNIWKTINKLKKPYLFFINKCDRAGSDTNRLIKNINDDLKINFVNINSIDNEGSENIAEIDKLTLDNITDSSFSEKIISNDDELLEKYLDEQNISKEDISGSLAEHVNSLELIPIIFGSAKYGVSIVSLLNFLSTFVKTPDTDLNTKPSGIIYKVEHDKKLGKVASVRLFSGIINNRDVLIIEGDENKISQIKQMQGPVYKDIGTLKAGDTAAVMGLNSVKAGNSFGMPDSQQKYTKLNSSVLNVKVLPKDSNHYAELVTALKELSAEDPELDMTWNNDLGEINIRIMGVIQLEILKAVIEEKYNINIEFDDPAVIYKETPKSGFTVVEEYTMPKPCWAVVRFVVEPLDTGSGVLYESKVGVNDIAIQYQQEVERNIPKALKQGIHGWEVTDLRITMIGDEDHNVHSRAGDFGVATHMALMKGLHETGTVFLEPILSYKIIAPEEYLGTIVGKLTQLRASFESSVNDEGNCIIVGIIPVATSIDFPITLASITKGKANYSTVFHGYTKCLPELAKSTPYRGVNPLDRAKFILKARNALI
jgi:ribosomal protection tetracycline resistance protein